MQTRKKLVIGFVAHVDTGKTTLSESVLFHTGTISKQGRVDSMDTFLDTETYEKERGITIYSKDARFMLDNTEVILVDTPGHVDFSTEMERVLPILDVAVLLISGSSGIQSHTKTLWSLLKSYRIPVYIFVNKMDMDGVDKDIILKSIKTSLSDNAVDFSNSQNNEFFEEIATCKESLLNTYFENGCIPAEEIQSAIFNREIFPVYFGSALKNTGIHDFLEGLKTYSLSMPQTLSSGDFSGIVYKISRDKDGKRLTHIKVLSGTLNIKDVLGNEKVNDIRIYSGNKYTSVTSVEAGDICAIAGLTQTRNNDTFGNISKHQPLLAPALNYAVKYPDDLDNNSMLSILKEYEEEDPSLNVTYNDQTHELNISLMGDIQAEILQRSINEKHNVKVTFSEGRICYKETVSQSVEGVGHFEPLRHYAEVHVRIEPLERGSGLRFECDISEDLLDRNWQRLIYTHLMERSHRGVLLGAPITDIKLSLISGRAHNKHTEGGDFRQATYRSIRQGLMELKSVGACHLLEPFYDYTLVLPNEYVGRAMTDINQMSGTAEITENDISEGITVLCGKAPVSEMNGYIKEVTAYSKGLGHLTYSLSGYDLCHNEEEVLSHTAYNPDSDLHNPSSSVFCSHGAGTIIPWYEVADYMHISYASSDGALGTNIDSITDNTLTDSSKDAALANRMRIQRMKNSDISISLEEIDSILHSSTHANEKGRQGSYKGISAASRETRLSQSRVYSSESEKKYKGSVQKQKYILVDGYNVIHAWDELSKISEVTLGGAIGRLNDILCSYQGIKEIPVMVVYDAYKVKGHPTTITEYNNITVVFTKEAQTADQYIERYAHENSKKYDITVVTSDGLEQIIVAGNGGKITSSREFKEEIERNIKEFNERFNVKSTN